MVVWQKFAGVVAMVRHLALFGSMQHSATSLGVFELQGLAAQTSLALMSSNSLPVPHQLFLAVVSAPMLEHLALVESLQHFATSADESGLQGSASQTVPSLSES